MKVWIIRHGESEANAQGLWTGWHDAPLTKTGEEDARLAATYLSGVRFDRVYTSDLIRARATAKIALPSYEAVPCDKLREIDLGSLAGKPKVATGGMKNVALTDGYAEFGGESRADFATRVRTFLASLEELNVENVALFSHAGYLRTAIDVVLGFTVPRKNLVCNNCAVLVLEYDEGVWRVFSLNNIK